MSQPGSNKFVVFLLGLILGGGGGYALTSLLSKAPGVGVENPTPTKYEIKLSDINDDMVLQDYLFMTASSKGECAGMEELAAEWGIPVEDLCKCASSYSEAVQKATGRKCPPPRIGCGITSDTSQRDTTQVEYFKASEFTTTFASAKVAESEMSKITYTLTAIPSGVLLASSDVNGNKAYDAKKGLAYFALGTLSNPEYTGLVRLSLVYADDKKVSYDINQVYGVTK